MAGGVTVVVVARVVLAIATVVAAVALAVLVARVIELSPAVRHSRVVISLSVVVLAFAIVAISDAFEFAFVHQRSRFDVQHFPLRFRALLLRLARLLGGLLVGGRLAVGFLARAAGAALAFAVLLLVGIVDRVIQVAHAAAAAAGGLCTRFVAVLNAVRLARLAARLL